MSLEVIILAAGQGTRMQSSLPKVLHPLAGKPMLAHVIDAARSLGCDQCHVVYGHGGEQVRTALDADDLNWVEQKEQLGTGHAVLQAMPNVSAAATVLVLYGDVPLISVSTLEALLTQATERPALLTAVLDDASGYGRILRDVSGQVLGVIEQKDATAEQLSINEINTGVLAAPAAQLQRWLPQVGNANSQQEYYLPDVLGLAVAEGVAVATTVAASASEVQGVNDRIQLAELEREYQLSAARELMTSGVTLIDPARIDIRGRLTCEPDVFIDCNTVFEGEVSIASGARIGANCVLINSHVGAGVEILPFCHLENARVDAGCVVGPYARLRPGAELAAGAKIGNFVEIKKSTIGPGSKVNHLSYVGDATLGAGVNVGAGTITCNYDGAHKHQTRMGDGVFIGSNSTLVAPLDIEAGGFVGAGSTITKAVEEDALAISRPRQRNIAGWKRPVKDQAPGGSSG